MKNLVNWGMAICLGLVIASCQTDDIQPEVFYLDGIVDGTFTSKTILEFNGSMPADFSEQVASFEEKLNAEEALLRAQGLIPAGLDVKYDFSADQNGLILTNAFLVISEDATQRQKDELAIGLNPYCDSDAYSSLKVSNLESAIAITVQVGFTAGCSETSYYEHGDGSVTVCFYPC